MKLTPRETEKLLLSYAGFVAERRKERGLKLNYVEAVAYISSELMELARDGRMIYVEVKPGPEIVPYIKDVFAKQKKATPKNTLFIAFNRKTCKKLKTLMPEYKVYWLTSSIVPRKGRKNTPVTAEYIIDGIRETNADGVDCHFNRDIVTEGLVKKVLDAGYEFHVWTVDDLSDALEAFRRGAKTVTTNCAKKLLDENAARNRK